MAANLELWLYDEDWEPVEKDPGTYALTLLGVRVDEVGGMTILATPQASGHLHDVDSTWPADPE